MATPTYIPIATTTLSSSASQVDFVGITQDFRDLVVVIDGTVGVNQATYINPNGDGSNLTYVRIYGTGSSAASDNSRVGLATTQSQLIWQFMDYSTTDKHKTFLVRASAANNQIAALAGRWASTSAITALSIFHNTSSFNSGTTFSIYGIAGVAA